MYEIADIPIISLRSLFEGDAKEESRLYDVCVAHGFFYLDYTGHTQWSGRAVNELFALAHDLFALKEEEKMKISIEHSKTYFGYKHRGANVVDKDGTRDQNESFNISKEDILNTECQHCRSLGLVSNGITESCRTFVLDSHNILIHILSTLSSMLSLRSEERMEHFHRIEGKSGDHLRLAKYAAHEKEPSTSDAGLVSSVMLVPHTGFGTLTLLLSEQPGLQLMDPCSKTWKYVKPKKDHAIINVGDTLTKFTNGLFRSCQHRVIKMSESDLIQFDGNPAISSKAKYSLGYFLRPEDDIVLRRLHSNLIPELTDPTAEVTILSKDWTDRRVNASKVSYFGQKTDWSDLRGTAVVWT